MPPTDFRDPLHTETALADRVQSLAARLRAIDPLASEFTDRRLERMLEVACRRLVSITLILEDLWDPHNASAIIRSAEGLGLDSVHFVEAGNRYRRNRGVLKGADRWLSIERYTATEDVFSALRQRGFRVAVADASEDPVRQQSARTLEELPVDSPLAIVMGAEKNGPSQAALELSDHTFTVAMAGFTTSFNVSVSAAIALFDVTRRRRDHLGAMGELDDREILDRVRDWMEATINRRTPPGLRPRSRHHGSESAPES